MVERSLLNGRGDFGADPALLADLRSIRDDVVDEP